MAQVLPIAYVFPFSASLRTLLVSHWQLLLQDVVVIVVDQLVDSRIGTLSGTLSQLNGPLLCFRFVSG